MKKPDRYSFYMGFPDFECGCEVGKCTDKETGEYYKIEDVDKILDQIKGLDKLLHLDEIERIFNEYEHYGIHFILKVLKHNAKKGKIKIELKEIK